MGNLTKNLSRHEFACKCNCGFDTIDYQLVEAIQNAADLLCIEHEADFAIIKITSGNRCKVHNKNEGGAPNSQHIHGRAADHRIFMVYGETREIVPTDVLADHYAEMYPHAGIGRYANGRVHLDTRSNGPARWDMRT